MCVRGVQVWVWGWVGVGVGVGGGGRVAHRVQVWGMWVYQCRWDVGVGGCGWVWVSVWTLTIHPPAGYAETHLEKHIMFHNQEKSPKLLR